MSSTNQDLPVAIIGAGPIGLAAAAHLIKRGETPIIFDAADQIAASVRTWGHVRMFSPWQYNIDDTARELLESNGWQTPPKTDLPTGDELVDEYLLPLAQTPEIAPHIHLNSRVIAISRRRSDKMKDVQREQQPFIIQVEQPDQEKSVRYFSARAIIDASGTWDTPNPIGSDGLTVPGEDRYADRIFYGIPNLLEKDKARYANQRVAVIGGGHSAINAILELQDLLADHPATQIHWILRKGKVNNAYGGLGDDALPGRGLLGIRIKQLVDAGKIQVHTPFYVQEIDAEPNADGIRIHGEDATGASEPIIVDQIIAATGARPNLSFLSELRVALDPVVESTPTLAPLIDPNLHSCGTVRPHGEAELRHPEKDFYIVGMKSYGRAPTFLLATGHEQVRSVVAGLAGDWDAAKDVQLSLPATGVCSGALPTAGEVATVVGTAIKNAVTSSCCDNDTRVAVEKDQPQPASACCSTVCCSSTTEEARELEKA